MPDPRSEIIDLQAYRDLHIDQIGEVKPKWDTGPCDHRRHIVDQNLRRVTCKDCGEVLDPIEVILQYISFWKGNQHYLDLIAKEQRVYRERAEEKRLKRHMRQVEHQGGTWACTVKGRYEYWDGADA